MNAGSKLKSIQTVSQQNTTGLDYNKQVWFTCMYRFYYSISESVAKGMNSYLKHDNSIQVAIYYSFNVVSLSENEWTSFWRYLDVYHYNIIRIYDYRSQCNIEFL